MAAGWQPHLQGPMFSLGKLYQPRAEQAEKPLKPFINVFSLGKLYRPRAEQAEKLLKPFINYSEARLKELSPISLISCAVETLPAMSAPLKSPSAKSRLNL